MKSINERIAVNFLGKKAKSPLVLPAGIMGMTWSGMKFTWQNGCGIITSKSLTTKPRSGHPGPVIAEFKGGLLNCMGLCNPGVKEGLAEVDEFKDRYDVPAIVSVFSTSEEEFCQLAEAVESSKGDFLELNLSCPNVMDEFGIPLAASKQQVGQIIKAVKKVTAKPVIAKLSPNVTGLTDICLAAEEAGADALCLINTLGPGMLIDIDLRRSVLSNRTGGLSGRCVKPIAIRAVYEAYSRVRIPIIGTGGVYNGRDAIEMYMAGASMIGVGTAIYERGIEVFDKINTEIISYMDYYGYDSLFDIPRLEKLDA